LPPPSAPREAAGAGRAGKPQEKWYKLRLIHENSPVDVAWLGGIFRMSVNFFYHHSKNRPHAVIHACDLAQFWLK
jgi:hypothetical protein